MSLRTASTTQSRQSLLDLQRTQTRLNENTQRISSGNRLTSPGDDPSASAMILDFGTSIGANTQFLKQAGAATNYLTSTESALNTAVSDVTRLMELMPAASGSNASSTAAVAPEVDAIRSSLLSLGNTQVQGKYIFAGTNTQTVPFVDAGLPTNTISYAGNSGSISVGISAQANVVTNLNGDTVFFGAGGQGSSTDLFKTVTDLSTGLSTNNQALVQSAGANLSGILDNLNKMLATVGGRQAGLNDMQNTLSGLNVTLQGLQDNLQATDYPGTMTQFNNDQTIQSATLSAMSKVSKTNLFDYLG